jgi:hypothetical protein
MLYCSGVHPPQCAFDDTDPRYKPIISATVTLRRRGMNSEGCSLSGQVRKTFGVVLGAFRILMWCRFAEHHLISQGQQHFSRQIYHDSFRTVYRGCR